MQGAHKTPLAQLTLNQEEISFIIPLQSVRQYYQQWRCSIQVAEHNKIYYKYLEGEGEILFKNGNKFIGNIHKGYYEGQGKFIWKQSQIEYTGNFHRNQIVGIGEFRYPDGSYYKGELKDGYRHGFGEFHQASPLKDEQYTYTGKWVMNKREGKGKIVYEKGAQYNGQWKNDLREGFGKMIYDTGNQYEGMWNKDKKEGEGTMNWMTEHEKYKGNWKNDVPNGYGEYYWFDSKTEYKIVKNFYRGFWKSGERDGYGVFFYANGCRFQGEFSKNEKNGWGLVIDEFGLMKLNKYKNDKLVYPNKNLSKQKVDPKNKTNSISLGKLPKIDHKPKIISKLHSNNSQTDQPFLQTNKISYLNAPIDNQYRKYLDFLHPCINSNFQNFLLRLNTRLHNLYKNVSASANQSKQYYSGVILENYWKIIRDSKVLGLGLHNHDMLISLADIDRSFSQGSRSWYSIIHEPKPTILNILKQHKQLLNHKQYSEIPWIYFFDALHKLSNQSLQQKQLIHELKKYQIPVNPIRDIHNPQQIILFRHFVCLIVHTGILLTPRNSPANKIKSTIETILNSFQANFDSTSLNNSIKHEKFSVNESHLTTQKHIVLPQWTEPIHNNFLHIIFVWLKKSQLLQVQDQTLSLKFVMGLLEKGNIFKDFNEKIVFIQKIQRWLNVRSILSKKQFRNYFLNACSEDETPVISGFIGKPTQVTDRLETLIKLSPYFRSIMKYQLNSKQIKQILFQTITRKIVGGFSPEEFRNCYKSVIQSMIRHFVEGGPSKMRKLKDKPQKTEKDAQKERMIEEFERKKKEEKERLLKIQEEDRQQKQRIKMAKQDQDAISIDDSNMQEIQDDDYYI